MSEPTYSDGRAEPTPSIPPTQPMSAERDDPRPPSQRRVRPRLVVRRLWSGGIGTAVVVALVVIVGVLLVRGVLNIPVLAAEGDGAYATVSLTTYAVVAAVIALIATAVFHVMLLYLPRPLQFFYWICALFTAVAVLLPFTTSAGAGPQVATAAINLVAGIAIMAMLGSVGASSIVVEKAAPRA
jgi:uncharacterized protein (DUF486 family)